MALRQAWSTPCSSGWKPWVAAVAPNCSMACLPSSSSGSIVWKMPSGWNLCKRAWTSAGEASGRATALVICASEH
eukprot:2035600-Heterocapsa_arctica.AAC.1